MKKVVSEAAMAKFCKYQGVRTVFFLARSPEAPRTMTTVLSLSSMVLRGTAVSKWRHQLKRGRIGGAE